MLELVRSMDSKVIERLIEIEAEAFGSGGLNVWYIEPLIRHGRVYIYRSGNQIQGLANYMLDWDNPKNAYMVGVSVAKEARGQGIGSKLLQESFAALRKENIEEVELTVDPDNTAAVNLYEKKLGFLVTDFRHDEYGKGKGRLIMKLNLANFAQKEL